MRQQTNPTDQVQQRLEKGRRERLAASAAPAAPPVRRPGRRYDAVNVLVWLGAALFLAAFWGGLAWGIYALTSG